MSTRLCPPTCPQVVQIGVHTGVGRDPLRLPSVLSELPPGTNCRCPAVAIPRTNVRVGDPRLLSRTFPPASAWTPRTRGWWAVRGGGRRVQQAAGDGTRVRPAAAAGRRRRAVGARRHAAVQGRDRRRRRGAPLGRLLPAGPRRHL